MFKPTLATLTKVELCVDKDGSPYSDLVVSIRDSLAGSDLTSISKTVGEIPSSLDWIEFDFSDISVTSSSMYYIVMRTSSGNILDYYVWDYGGNNPYADGSRWSSRTSESS